MWQDVVRRGRARSFLRRPLATSRGIAAATGLSHVTVNKVFEHLCRQDIVRELTGQKRNRVFSYTEYLGILDEGTELPE